MASSSDTKCFIIWALILTCLTIWQINESEGAKATEHVYLDHVICNYNPKFTSNCACKLKFITRMTKSFTAFCNITEPMDNVMSHSQLFYKFRNGYQLFLVDIYLKVCDYLRNKAGSKLMDIVWPKIQKYLVVDGKLACPYSGRFDIVDLPATGDFLNNMFVPVGDYMWNVTITTDSILQFLQEKLLKMTEWDVDFAYWIC